MKIHVRDPDHVRDLLRFLRARGCIAYRHSSLEIEALRPYSFRSEEAVEIRQLLGAWRAANPAADARLDTPPP
jgi:hypothetical protein